MVEIFDFIVEFTDRGKPCICGNCFRGLGKVTVKGFFKSIRIRRAYNIIHREYPKYKGFIQYI